jgi:hypothetical protein
MIIQISLVLLLFFSSNVFAQHDDTKQAETHDSGSEEHGAHFHPNHFAIFTGGTTELVHDKDTNFTLGADYTRRFTESGRVGIGVFGEVIFAKHTEYLVGIPLYVYPTNNFWLRAGPGLEIYKEKSHSASQSASEMAEGGKKETKTGFLIRTGLGYSFEVGGFQIVPSVDVDFLRNKTSLVWGVNFTKGF